VDIRPSAKDISLKYISCIDFVVLGFGIELLFLCTCNTNRIGNLIFFVFSPQSESRLSNIFNNTISSLNPPRWVCYINFSPSTIFIQWSAALLWNSTCSFLILFPSLAILDSRQLFIFCTFITWSLQFRTTVVPM